MTHEEMLQALQDDVNAWPQRVKSAGVKNAAGSAYSPQSRNNQVLRTPDDPAATLAYMLHAWEAPDADSGSPGWERIIEQAGPKLTWEWLIADPDKPYASLFSDELRNRVRTALEAMPGNAVWSENNRQKEAAADARDARIRKIQEEMRSGTRSRLRF